MNTLDNKRSLSLSALKHVIPLMQERDFRWVITGGFACYVYGVEREITDIDIDIDTTKEDPYFQSLQAELESYITQPLLHYVDQNYDNYNFEATFDEVVIDICSMAELKKFDKATASFMPCYPHGYPDVELVPFEGIELPLLSKRWIIKDKEQLIWQRESDIKDIEGLKRLLKA